MSWIFEWVPDRNFTRDNTPVIYETQFDDGYRMRTAPVINNFKESWSIGFKNRTTTEINAIVDFLKSTNGVEAITWTPPGEVTAVNVLATKWNKTYITNDISSLSVTFDRVYE